jgi:hypothetical protein
MQREMTGQHRNSSRLLVPPQNSSFVFKPDDRPDAVVRAHPQDPVTLLLEKVAEPYLAVIRDFLVRRGL